LHAGKLNRAIFIRMLIWLAEIYIYIYIGDREKKKIVIECSLEESSWIGEGLMIIE
jgi:hypothetical protein